LTFFDSGELSGLKAQAALTLGDYATAEDAAAYTTSRIDSRFARNRFMHTITQAEAQLGRRQVDNACNTTLAVLDAAPRVRSERAKNALSILRQKFSQQPSKAAKDLLATWDDHGVTAQ
jgi:hypothetical protein